MKYQGECLLPNECPFTDAHCHSRNCSGGDVVRVINLPDGVSDISTGQGGDVIFSAGIHPWNTMPDSDCGALIADLRRTIKKTNCAAVGECGLDTLRGAPMNVQKKIFECAAKLSFELGLPMIIHCVRAWNNIVSIHRKMSDGRKLPTWVIHGFRGSEKLADELISEGFVLSFGASLMKNEMPFFAKLEDSSFLLETDDSKLDVRDICSAAAQIRGTDVYTLRKTTFDTFRKIFMKG